MNLRRLKYFVTLAEEKNFTAASNVLFISQPTLSQEIMKMEKEYGFKLFNRTSRNVTLTKEGERLLPEAQNLLRKSDDLVQLIISLKQEQRNTREFVIGLDAGWDQFEYIGVTRMIKEFRTDYPSMVVKLTPFNYPDSFQQIDSGYMNVGIIFVSDKLVDELKCAYRVIETEEMCLAVPRDAISGEEVPDIGRILKDNMMLSLAADDDYMYGVNKLYRKYNLRPEVLEVNDMRLMLEYIGAGGGIGLVPNSYSENARQESVTFLKLGEDAPVGHLVIVWNEARFKNKIVKDFVNRLSVDESS